VVPARKLRRGGRAGGRYGHGLQDARRREAQRAAAGGWVVEDGVDGGLRVCACLARAGVVTRWSQDQFH